MVLWMASPAANPACKLLLPAFISSIIFFVLSFPFIIILLLMSLLSLFISRDTNSPSVNYGNFHTQKTFFFSFFRFYFYFFFSPYKKKIPPADSFSTPNAHHAKSTTSDFSSKSLSSEKGKDH